MCYKCKAYNDLEQKAYIFRTRENEETQRKIRSEKRTDKILAKAKYDLPKHWNPDDK